MIDEAIRSLTDRVREFQAVLTRGRRHRERLADVDYRLTVTGTRGKSTMTRWLHDEFVARGLDTYAKITGEEAVSLRNGTVELIDRDERVTLYENEQEIRRHHPMEALIVENQGITGYTTRLVNERYVDAQLVVLTNVREDHLDTLGYDLEAIARELARAVPSGAHVISGEQNEPLHRYVERELGHRGATIAQVEIPDEHATVVGSELVYCMDAVLREFELEPLTDRQIESYLDRLRIDWTQLPKGRVYNAAAVNDVESTELVRRSLVQDEPRPTIQPLVYLRKDRPGRTSSYARYLDHLADRGIIEQARIVDGHHAAFTNAVDFPVIVHSDGEEPAAVLDAALSDGWPVILMGNTVPEFMQRMDEIVRARAVGETEFDWGSIGPVEAPPDEPVEGRDPGRDPGPVEDAESADRGRSVDR